MLRPKPKILFISFTSLNYGAHLLSESLYEKYDPYLFTFLDFGDFDIIYNNVYKKKLCLEKIGKLCSGFDYIAISANSVFKKTAFIVSDYIRKKTDAKVIIGGYLGITESEESIKHCDYVCTWEGEYLVDLLDKIESGDKIKSLTNMISKDKKIKTEIRSADFDDIPSPTYSRFIRYYFYYGGNILEKNIFRPLETMVESSRGCPFGCSFCSNSYTNCFKRDNKIPIVRRKSIYRLVTEMQNVYPITTIFEVIDENFFARTKDEVSFFADYYSKNFNDRELILTLDMRSPDFIDKFRAISKIKTLTIATGIQSGSESFRMKEYRRNITNKQILDIVKRIDEIKGKSGNKIIMHYDFIIFNPLETEKDVLDSINIMLKLDGHMFLSSFVGLPKTDIDDELGKLGINTDGLSYSGVNKNMLSRFPFYYFFMFVITFLKKKKLGFILPKNYKPGFFSGFLNSKMFVGIYSRMISISYMSGQREFRKHVFRELNVNRRTLKVLL